MHTFMYQLRKMENIHLPPLFEREQSGACKDIGLTSELY